MGKPANTRLCKIGLTVRELKKATTIQLAVLFTPFLRSVRCKASWPLPSGCMPGLSLIVFFLALSLYFLLLRARYLHELIAILSGGCHSVR